MNLQELQESKKTKVLGKALREHYEIKLDFDRLDKVNTVAMLGRVRGLLKESRVGTKQYESHSNPAYMKLLMLEQALSAHLTDLRAHQARIVLENEEVQKSQVILAAQDMIDNVQKMLEQVSKMNVEELSAVVEGVKNEFGVSEGDQFQQSASEALATLQEALGTAKSGLQSALGTITGDGPVGGADLGADLGGDMAAPAEEPEMPQDIEGEAGEVPELPGLPEPEEEPELRGAGRERR